jgi:hypothetical protein
LFPDNLHFSTRKRNHSPTRVATRQGGLIKDSEGNIFAIVQRM